MKLGIEKTLGFLGKTKILTRRWFLGLLDLDNLDERPRVAISYSRASDST